MNRRNFLMSATAVGAALADEKPLRVGVIGCGWYGKSDIFRLNQIAPIEIVSLCDVDRAALETAADWSAAKQPSRKRPRLYKDYREMLREKDLDMVEIATPDHWHALPMIAACEAGADIYVQKPISVDIVEGQAMLAAARKHARVVQVGTQRRSTPHLIEARREIIESGKLGKVGLVEICSYSRGRGPAPLPPATPVPETLDYDFWTGPAPMVPYNRVRVSNWRSFMEYGNGTLGDMGIHMLDMTRWFLNLGWPKAVSSSGGLIVNRGGFANIPDTQTVLFEFDDLTVIWQHRNWGLPPDPKYPWAATLYGDNGVLKAGVFAYDYTPARTGTPVHRDVTYELDKYPEDNVEPRLEKHVAPAIRGHMANLLECRKNRSKPVADIEQGYISTACCILGNMSLRLGRSLAWDAAAGRIKGDEEANRQLRRPYRAPWKHPEA